MEARSNEFGKVPPQAKDLEQAVLAACLLEADAFIKVLGILRMDMFYVESHGLIFNIMNKLYDDGKPIDILTVVEEATKQKKLEEIGGPYALAEITNKINSADNIEYHARIVQEKYMSRSLIQICSQITSDAYSGVDAFELQDDLNEYITAVESGFSKSSYETVKDVHVRLIKEKFDSDDIALSPVTTGVSDLDVVLTGLQPESLIVIAARPAMGKTALMITSAIETSRRSLPVGVFSLEMSNNQLIERALSSYEDIYASDIRKNQFSNELDRNKIFNSKIGGLPLFLQDSAVNDIHSIMRQAREWKRKHNIQAIYIDYLQLIQIEGSKNLSEEQEVNKISRMLKLLAKELKIPIICLSQLSRAVEQRGGTKRPIMSDLRGSGQIEANCDQIMMLYRAEYYGFDTLEDGRSSDRIAEIIIGKNRHGVTGSVEALFDAPKVAFRDIPFNH